jgi:TrmH family RNA methyltransferase
LGGAVFTLLTSRENPLVKQIISLKTKKGRRKHRLFLAEGPHLLEEALVSNFEVKHIITKGEVLPDTALLEVVKKRGIPISSVSPYLYKDLSETDTPQDVLGLISLPIEDVEFPEVKEKYLGLILHQIQDPGNLGTIIRTSWAAGIKDIFITPGTVDPYSGKVVRASQGGIFNVRIISSPLHAILSWATMGRIKIWAADPQGTHLYFQQDFTDSTMFLLGNEARGFGFPDNSFKESLDYLRIPLPGGAESLNVAISAGILIYDAIRQRLI